MTSDDEGMTLLQAISEARAAGLSLEEFISRVAGGRAQ